MAIAREHKRRIISSESNDKVYLDIIQRRTELKMTVQNLHASFLIIYVRVFNCAYVVYAKCLTQFMIILNKSSLCQVSDTIHDHTSV